ncbi:hypothetical protein LguiB_020351 [Lonicera macranthoides]
MTGHDQEKESVSNTDSTFSLKSQICVTDTPCSSKRSRLSRANMSVSEFSPVNAPVTWNITKSFTACIDGVLELGFDGHQMSLAIAKFIKSEAERKGENNNENAGEINDGPLTCLPLWHRQRERPRERLERTKHGEGMIAYSTLSLSLATTSIESIANLKSLSTQIKLKRMQEMF